MSVSAQTALPAQPTTGSVALVPLGGDGWVAPHSAYTIEQTVTHDASGGSATNEIRFDPRYTQLLSYINCLQTSGADAVEVAFSVECSSNDRILVIKSLPLVAVSGLSTTNTGLWTPPAILCSAGLGVAGDLPFFRVVVDNVDTETTIMRARVYNFDKRARERVPLPQLLGTLVRGTNFD